MKIKILSLLLAFALTINLIAQEEKKDTANQKKYVFTETTNIKTTSVKNQQSSGTCWSFATLSFLESEMIRMGKEPIDFSEMFIARHNYQDRAVDYARFHGKKLFGEGAEAWDVINVLKKYGIVPQNEYIGLEYGTEKHKHGELVTGLQGYMDGILKNKNKKLSTAWHKGYCGILDAYFGDVPESFTYDGKEYTPKSFLKYTGLNPDDYIPITSYSHHPFYEKFIFESPDNWSLGQVYNLPMEDMIRVINNSLENGYTLAWGSDVSEKGINFQEGVVIVPLKEWSDKSSDEKKNTCKIPEAEKLITQEMRQETWDNHSTTEDHLMHMIGMAKDQDGNIFYKVKNSWGDKIGYDGCFYASLAFVKYKTVGMQINKNALPKDIAKKLGF